MKWWSDALGEPPDTSDLPEDIYVDEYLASLGKWWEMTEKILRQRLDENDERMVESYKKRADLATVDVRSMLTPGAQVIMR